MPPCKVEYTTVEAVCAARKFRIRILLYSGQTGLAAVNWKAVALAAVLLVLTRWCKPTKGLHPIVFILASAIIGVVFSF